MFVKQVFCGFTVACGLLLAALPAKAETIFLDETSPAFPAPFSARTISSTNTYDPNNYRRGDFIRVWPKHGVWQLGLLSGGQSGEDDCVIGTSDGAQTATFSIQFIFDGGAFSDGTTLDFSDGGMMGVILADTDFQAANDGNMNSLGDLWDKSDVNMSIDSWKFFEKHIIRQLVTVNGLQWAETPFPQIVAWGMPNPGDASQVSTLDILDHMRKGKELVIRSWMMTRRIPLAGFGATLDEFSQCTDMQPDSTQ